MERAARFPLAAGALQLNQFARYRWNGKVAAYGLEVDPAVHAALGGKPPRLPGM